MKLSVIYIITDWLEGTTHSYAEFLNEDAGWSQFWLKSKLRLADILGRRSPLAAYEFPHMSTIDQSMYVDQVLSLIGLGYIQGSNLSQSIGESR